MKWLSKTPTKLRFRTDYSLFLLFFGVSCLAIFLGAAWLVLTHPEEKAWERMPFQLIFWSLLCIGLFLGCSYHALQVEEFEFDAEKRIFSHREQFLGKRTLLTEIPFEDILALKLKVLLDEDGDPDYYRVNIQIPVENPDSLRHLSGHVNSRQSKILDAFDVPEAYRPAEIVLDSVYPIYIEFQKEDAEYLAGKIREVVGRSLDIIDEEVS